MQRDSSRVERNDIYVYLIAGVATASMFMEKFRVTIHEKLAQGGRKVHSELLFPYGDRSRRVVPQIWEVRHDMRLSFSWVTSSIGGNRLLTAIQPQIPMGQDHTIILIGHSGGGVASVHAAQLMLERHIGTQPRPVVMIGSPRVRIPDILQSSVLSLYAMGNSRDLISRLGTFGGWSAGLNRIPIWKPDKHAPANIQALPIIGGHPDYFRDRDPYINPMGKSNLDLTMEAIEQWLYPSTH